MNTSTWKIPSARSLPRHSGFHRRKEEGITVIPLPWVLSSCRSWPGLAPLTPDCPSPAQPQPRASAPIYLPAPAWLSKMFWIGRYKMMFHGLAGVLHLRNSPLNKEMSLAVLPCPSPVRGLERTRAEHSWVFQWSRTQHSCSFR